MKNSKGYEEDLYTKGCIRTFTGIYVDILNPTPEMFCIEDIAHALSQIPRFGGHLPIWYSVACHSISCARMSVKDNNPDSITYDCLMHDCSEAYLGDVMSPLKKLIPQYSEIEERFMNILSKKFNFEYPLNKEVKRIDNLILEREWSHLFLNGNQQRGITPKKNELVYNDFLNIFKELQPLQSKINNLDHSQFHLLP